jgi:hypothetical protein
MTCALSGPDAVDVAGQVLQPGRREVLRVRLRVVERRAARAGQEDQVDLRPRADGVQVDRLEGLDPHPRAAVVEAEPVQRAQQGRLQFKTESTVVRRVLGLRNDADVAAELLRQPGPQAEHLLEGRHLEQPVVQGVALPDGGQPLDGAQRLELGEGEVGDEPAGGAGRRLSPGFPRHSGRDWIDRAATTTCRSHKRHRKHLSKALALS